MSATPPTYRAAPPALGSAELGHVEAPA